MHRTTIDFGIDLGTTNSAIAELKGIDVEVYKNNEGVEYTPSAVWIDKKDRCWVGRQAREKLEADPQNAHSEFKLQMGTDNDYLFARSGRRMKSFELSAEVLKSLRNDVTQRTGEDVHAAVITVPAAFEARQCEATNQAARLAGLELSFLLQEPVAAALAYGFQSDSDKVFWMVYDLGGGTFDAAIIQVRDGIIQVINHGGDNHLGGKLIDWAIVDELLIPAVVKEYPLTDFKRGNPKFHAAIAKLKLAAENAKIRLSRENATEIMIEFLCPDDNGNPVNLEYEFKKSDLEKLTAPFIRRSINICRKVLLEKRLASGNIEKVLLVGGSTIMPFIRETLEDPKEGLGIPLEFRVDPLTVVARGAAIFAGTQRNTLRQFATEDKGQTRIQLEYEPMGTDTEPLVGGKVLLPDDTDHAGYTIEFINDDAKPPWRSGKIPLSAAGDFMGTLWAEKGRINHFSIELICPKGNRLETAPDKLRYTVGLSITEQPLIHSLGVAMANNEVDLFFEKGAPLPIRKRVVHRTVFDTQKGQAENLIRIPVVEGENLHRADRNKLLGYLEIGASDIRRDVPAGSEVEITIEIDSSRIIRTRAYVPILDEEYEQVLHFDQSAPDAEALRSSVEQEKNRLEEVKKKARQVSDLKTQQLLQRIEEENMEHDLHSTLQASHSDRDAADKCASRLRDFKVIIDEVEDALEWPALLAEAEESLKDVRQTVQEYGDNSDKQNLATLEGETRKAMDTRNADLLRRKISALDGLRIRLMREQPEFWLAYLNYLEGKKPMLKDPSQAEKYIDQGHRAINNNDLPSLKAAVQQLIALLPASEQQKAAGYGGTTIK